MNKEKMSKIFRDNNKFYISLYKKIGYSITKFEKYPEMAIEGVGKAIIYLMFLSLISSFILSLCVSFKLRDGIRESINFFDKNVSEANYENGNLNIEVVGENKIVTNYGALIIDTGEITEEQKKKYEAEVSEKQIGIIWLKDSVLVNSNENQVIYNYKELFNQLNISNFDKAAIINFLHESIDNFRIYSIYFLVEFAVLFITFIIYTIADILILFVFGLLTTLILKMKIKISVLFNMSVYAITISAILQTIYRIVGLYLDFQIKYFSIMYNAISYICLAAAIFMIRSDLLKGQMQLIKIEKEKEKTKLDVIKQEDTQDEKNEENKNENKEEKENKDNKEKNKLKPRVEGEG